MRFTEIHISQDTLRGWQYLLDIMAEKFIIPAALIMKIDLPKIKVLLSSKSKENKYEAGDSEVLLGSGLYCERVFNSKSKLLVPNALKDQEWDKNPDIKLGMISYIGFPILWPNKDVFGTICMLDSKENFYKGEHSKVLMQFKEYIEAYLSLEIAKYLQSDQEELMAKEMHCDKRLSLIEKILHNKKK